MIDAIQYNFISDDLIPKVQQHSGLLVKEYNDVISGKFNVEFTYKDTHDIFNIEHTYIKETNQWTFIVSNNDNILDVDDILLLYANLVIDDQLNSK